MSVDEIRMRAKKSIAKVSGLRVEQIGDEDSFDVLELDSLSRIEVLVELEREFKLQTPEDDEDDNLASDIKTVGHAVEYIQRSLAGASIA